MFCQNKFQISTELKAYIFIPKYPLNREKERLEFLTQFLNIYNISPTVISNETFDQIALCRFPNIKITRNDFPVVTLMSHFIGGIQSVQAFFESTNHRSLKKATIYISKSETSINESESRDLQRAQCILKDYDYNFEVKIQPKTNEEINQLIHIKNFDADIFPQIVLCNVYIKNIEKLEYFLSKYYVLSADSSSNNDNNEQTSSIRIITI